MCSYSAVFLFSFVLQNSNPPQNLQFFYEESVCIRFPVGTGLAGHTEKTGNILNISDVYADKRFNKSIDKQTGFVTKHMLSAPIKSRSGNETLAVIQMLNKKGEEGGFTAKDEDIIQSCSSACAEALDLQFQTLQTAKLNLESVQ